METATNFIDTDKMIHDAYSCDFSTLIPVLQLLKQRKMVAERYINTVKYYPNEQRQHLEELVSQYNKEIISYLGLIILENR